MSLFYGPIGFVDTVEEPEGSGIWVEKPIARMYRGEVSRNVKRWDNGDQLNPNLNISNTISIVADPYLNDHLNSIRYIGWLGGYWSISSCRLSLLITSASQAVAALYEVRKRCSIPKSFSGSMQCTACRVSVRRYDLSSATVSVSMSPLVRIISSLHGESACAMTEPFLWWCRAKTVLSAISLSSLSVRPMKSGRCVIISFFIAISYFILSFLLMSCFVVPLSSYISMYCMS